MNTQLYNVTNTDIWKRVDNIGSTKYINITDGTSQTVPWGSVDWVSILWSNALGIAITGGLVYAGLHYLLKVI